MYKGIIYCATSPSNKKYYGQSIGSLEKRIKKHYSSRSSKDNTIFHNALQKYKKLIKWEIIDSYEFFEREDLINKLNEREIYWIERDKTCIAKYGKEFGYNMTEGGQGIKLYHHTDLTKEKIRKKLKGKPKSLESKENYRLANLGKNNPMYGKISHWRGSHLSAKNKENLRKLYKDKTYEEIHGKEKAKEIKNRLSISLKGKNTGKIVTDETKNKLRQSSMKQFASVEGKAKHKNATKLAMESPEIRKRFLEGIQKREEKRKLKKIMEIPETHSRFFP